MGAGKLLPALALAIFFTVVGAYWNKWSMFPRPTVGLCTAVPPIPAIATLIFLIVVREALRGAPGRFRLSRSQIVIVYTFVSISVLIGFGGFYRSILLMVTAPKYGVQTHLQQVKDYVPFWLAPTDQAVVTQFWEGSPTGAVPWKEWLVPMLGIGASILLFYIMVISLLRLLYRRWSKEERLTYPIAQLALSMVEYDGEGGGAGAR